MSKVGLMTVFLVAYCVGLSGCKSSSLLGKDPRCPFTETGACHSIKTINRLIDENRLTSDENVGQQPTYACCVLRKKKMRVYLPEEDKFGQPIAGYAPDNSAVRVG